MAQNKLVIKTPHQCVKEYEPFTLLILPFYAILNYLYVYEYINMRADMGPTLAAHASM